MTPVERLLSDLEEKRDYAGTIEDLADADDRQERLERLLREIEKDRVLDFGDLENEEEDRRPWWAHSVASFRWR
jgi:hypothetical protein